MGYQGTTPSRILNQIAAIRLHKAGLEEPEIAEVMRGKLDLSAVNYALKEYGRREDHLFRKLGAKQSRSQGTNKIMSEDFIMTSEDDVEN